MVLGVHFTPVSASAAAPEPMNIRFLSRDRSLTASATAELGTSMTIATSCVSYH